MSAYVCSPEHFQALAIYATSRSSLGDYKVDPRYLKYRHADFGKARNKHHVELASYYADLLFQENVRSVMTRYPQDTRETLPGPINLPEHVTVTGRQLSLAAYRVRPIDVLKMAACLEYQSCETEDWHETPAKALLDAIKEAAIRNLPGYEDAIRDFSLA